MAPRVEISCRYPALRHWRECACRHHRHSCLQTNKHKQRPDIKMLLLRSQAHILMPVVAIKEAFRCSDLLKSSSSRSHQQGSVWDLNSEPRRTCLFSQHNDLTSWYHLKCHMIRRWTAENRGVWKIHVQRSSSLCGSFGWKWFVLIKIKQKPSRVVLQTLRESSSFRLFSFNFRTLMRIDEKSHLCAVRCLLHCCFTEPTPGLSKHVSRFTAKWKTAELERRYFSEFIFFLFLQGRPTSLLD